MPARAHAHTHRCAHAHTRSNIPAHWYNIRWLHTAVTQKVLGLAHVCGQDGGQTRSGHAMTDPEHALGWECPHDHRDGTGWLAARPSITCVYTGKCTHRHAGWGLRTVRTGTCACLGRGQRAGATQANEQVLYRPTSRCYAGQRAGAMRANEQVLYRPTSR